jgi:hypothetical protein
MITKEDLEKTSFKHWLTEKHREYLEIHGKKNDVIRDPNTTVGFMSIAKAQEVVFGDNLDMLGHHRLTMCDFYEDPVTYLADDHRTGFNLFSVDIATLGDWVNKRAAVPSGFSQRVEHLLFVYCEGRYIIDSIDELLAFANESKLPDRKQLRYEEILRDDQPFITIELQNEDGEWWRAGEYAYEDAFNKYPYNQFVWNRFKK